MASVLFWACAALGVAGLAMMLISFALVSRNGGWKKSITEPSCRKEWPPARMLMMLGAGCGVLFSLGKGLLGALGKWPWQ